MPEKIILDTDIGDDVDDALALAFALLSPAIELMGVTTVHGNTRLRAQIADQLIDVFGFSGIPVREGHGEPLACSVDCAAEPFLYEAVAEEYRGRSYGDAVDFMLDCVRSGKCTTIVSIGALTNVARCIERDPGTMRKARLVLMGGMVTKAYPESNILADPEAAAIVFASPTEKTMIGLDVTLCCSLPHERLQGFYNRSEEKYRFLTKLIRTWQKNVYAELLLRWSRPGEDAWQSGTGAHDPMAVAFVSCPSLFTLRDAHVLVETRGEYTRGVTVDDFDVFAGVPKGRNCSVAIAVDTDTFLDLYFETLLGEET